MRIVPSVRSMLTMTCALTRWCDIWRKLEPEVRIFKSLLTCVAVSSMFDHCDCTVL